MITAADIVLATVNARYMHASFGLRYLFANLDELQPKAKIAEYVLGKSAKDIVEDLLEHRPKIIGLGVYIWNTSVTLEVVSILKRVAPEIIVILGGPEVSFETETQDLFKICNYVIKGEAEFLFRDLCREILSGKLPETKIISGPLPDVEEIKLPYSEYKDQDVAHRVIYVEASRGCPYKCEYCLSALDKSVRNFPIQKFLKEMDVLIERGVRQFKFVDRTFNLSPSISTSILQFFLEKIELGLFLHFELVPDRLPEELKKLIAQFPAGSLQFEIGVQTWNPEVAATVSRRQNYVKIKENFAFLKNSSQVHTHADLIVGLPGETRDSFGRGFDALVDCQPDEVQVGILKRLKGTPIIRHDEKYQMVYNEFAPFQLLSNKDVSYQEMQKFQRFSQYWDAVVNSGNFPLLLPFFHSQKGQFEDSLFELIWHMSDFLFKRHGQAHAIAKSNLEVSLRLYLVESFGITEAEASTLTGASKKYPALDKATPVRQMKHLSSNILSLPG